MEDIKGTFIEINRSNFKFNLSQIYKIIGKNVEIMPVIKANAYGTCINQNLELISDFNIVGVAIVKEGIYLRNLGFKNQIFLLNQPLNEEIEDIIKYELTVSVASIDFLKQLEKYDKKIKIHLELETGMGRTGINYEDLNDIVKVIINNSNIIIEGVYTHLSSADSDDKYTNEQIRLFKKGVDKLRESISDIKYIHALASAGILNCNIDISNMVRPGLLLYGHKPSSKNLKNIELKPVSKLVSKISFIKDIDKGMSLGYGRTFISDKEMKIATVSIGYADGAKRGLSNNGKVVINGKIANIVGNVCMNSLLVDVTEIENVKVGDNVYIWDNNLITLEDVAKECNTISYEILSTISDRVPRKYID